MSAARRPVLLVVSDDNALVRQVAKMTSELCEVIVARSSFRVTAILNAGQPIGALLVARTLNANAKIITRCHYTSAGFQAKDAGADEVVVSETVVATEMTALISSALIKPA